MSADPKNTRPVCADPACGHLLADHGAGIYRDGLLGARLPGSVYDRLAPIVEAAERGLPVPAVSREALGLEPSVDDLLARIYADQRESEARAGYVRTAEVYGDAWCPVIAYVHGFAWYPPLNPVRGGDTEPGADTA